MRALLCSLRLQVYFPVGVQRHWKRLKSFVFSRTKSPFEKGETDVRAYFQGVFGARLAVNATVNGPVQTVAQHFVAEYVVLVKRVRFLFENSHLSVVVVFSISRLSVA